MHMCEWQQVQQAEMLNLCNHGLKNINMFTETPQPLCYEKLQLLTNPASKSQHQQ